MPNPTTPLEVYGWDTGIASARPRQPIAVDDHAEANLIITIGSNPGPFRLSATPYTRLPLQMFNAPGVNHIRLCYGTQLGKTVTLLCYLGYILDQAPGPTMMLYPDQVTGRGESKERLQPMFHACPSWRKQLTGVEDDMQLLNYKLRNMFVFFGWNSLSSVARRPIKYLIKDETAMQAPQINRASNDRTKTFMGRKIVEASSPRLVDDLCWHPLGLQRDHELEDAVKLAYGEEETPGGRMPVIRHKDAKKISLHRFHVPCPFCKTKQILYPDRIRWPRDCAIGALTYEAYYECAECGERIYDKHKRDMLLGGEWRSDNPGCSTVGFHLSSLYSNMGDACNFGEIAAAFINTRRKPAEYEAFINGTLALPYEPEEYGDDVFNMSLTYRRSQEDKDARYMRQDRECPPEVLAITGAIDVHKEFLAYTAWGWDANKHGYLLDWEFASIDMENDPDAGLAYIERKRKQPFNQACGKQSKDMHIAGFAVDSGYKTEDVYKWSRACKWIIPVKGTRGNVMVPDGAEAWVKARKRLEKMPSSGEKIKRAEGLYFVTINTGFAKREMYAELAADKWHFPMDIDQDFLSQLNSEKLVKRLSERKGIWERYYVQKRRGEDEDKDTSGKGKLKNHYLDCTVYSRVMLEEILYRYRCATMEELNAKLYTKAVEPDTPRKKKGGNIMGE